jgi:threonyl-tRNA synthetase
VGDKEVEAESLAVRDRAGNDLGVMTIDEFSVLLQQDVERLGRTSEPVEKV